MPLFSLFATVSTVGISCRGVDVCNLAQCFAKLICVGGQEAPR